MIQEWKYSGPEGYIKGGIRTGGFRRGGMRNRKDAIERRDTVMYRWRKGREGRK